MRKISNQLPAGYTIRFAEKSDVSNIMKFIEKHWKQNHILARDKAFFEYEFGIHSQKINFVLLLNEQKEIAGILGFIPYDNTNRDMFTVMWKVLEHDEIMFGGVLLLQFLIENGDCRHIYTSGINESTRNIYRYLRLQTENLKHFYRLNPNMEQHLAVIKELCGFYNADTEHGKYSLILVSNTDDFEERYQPSDNLECISKSLEYIIHRYFKHPKYEYLVYEICKEGISCHSYIIMRVQECNGSKALRVIDYLGDVRLIGELNYSIGCLLEELQCEYIDFYEYGVDDEVMEQAGFVRNSVDSQNIVPNYFAPYVAQNINIGIVFEKETRPVIFKGDGDQDRPS